MCTEQTMPRMTSTKADNTAQKHLLSPCHSVSHTRRHSWSGISNNDITAIGLQAWDQKANVLNHEWFVEDESTERSIYIPRQVSEKDDKRNGPVENDLQNVSFHQNSIAADIETRQGICNNSIKKNPQAIANKHEKIIPLKTSGLPKSQNSISKCVGSKTMHDRLSMTIPEDSVSHQEGCYKTPVVLQTKLQPFGSRSRSIYNRRATVHYTTTGRPSFSNTFSRTACLSLRAKEVLALNQLNEIFRNYLVYRLRRYNLDGSVKLISMRHQLKDRQLFDDVLFVCKYLETKGLNNYEDICKQIGVTLTSKNILRKLFFQLAAEILTTESDQSNKVRKKNEDSFSDCNTLYNIANDFAALSSCMEITWGRICAVFTIAGGLAVDCVQQHHPGFVLNLVEYCGEFLQEQGVLKWIANQGGWERFQNSSFELTSRKTSRKKCSLVILQYTAMVITAVCMVMSIVIEIDVVGNLGVNEKQ